MTVMPRRKPSSTEDDAFRWDAVALRDRTADGQFVYAVSSTGIYCRPSCPSRRPRRDRVAFFATPLEATRAGYRACRRCHPDAATHADPWADKIRRACIYLANVDGHPSLAALARRIGGSPYHLQRNFKRSVGVTPREYAEACRLTNVKRHLRDGRAVTGALFEAGYGSSSRFYERAVPKLGMTPSAYRRGGAGVIVEYTIVSCPLGRLLVAATERGVCAVSMGDGDTELEAALREEYPHATSAVRRRAGSPLSRWTRAVVAHLSSPRQAPRPTPRQTTDLPLDIRATAFQWRVWQALSAIPSGETRSYAEVARAIGRPSAVRAVARACATNPVALVIPCHRVVQATGALAGYRWGIERKRQLLVRERRK